MNNISLYLPQIINIIPKVITLIFAIYYLLKAKSIDGIFISIGTLTAIISSILSIYTTSLIVRSHQYDIRSIQTISGVISFISIVTFTLGLILLILKVLKLEGKNTTNRDNIDEIGE